MKSRLIFQRVGPIGVVLLGLGCLAVSACNLSGAAPETPKSELERSNRQHATSKSSSVITIEITKNEDDADLLVTTMKGLPGIPDQVDETYDLYVCWLDEPGASGSWPTEKRMERHGSVRGGSGTFTFTLDLNAPFMKGQGDYYGRGRVCVMAVSSRGSYVSNIVSVPKKRGEASRAQ